MLASALSNLCWHSASNLLTASAVRDTKWLKNASTRFLCRHGGGGGGGGGGGDVVEVEAEVEEEEDGALISSLHYSTVQ